MVINLHIPMVYIYAYEGKKREKIAKNITEFNYYVVKWSSKKDTEHQVSIRYCVLFGNYLRHK